MAIGIDGLSKNSQKQKQLVRNVPEDDPSKNSELQLVAHVTTSDSEVPNNNISGQQPAPPVTTTGTEATNNNTNNISGQQDSNNDSDLKFGTFVAAADIVTGILSIVFNPPISDEPLYSVAVGTVVTAGILQALDVLWVSYSAPRRRTRMGRIFERVIQFISLAAIIFGIVFNIYAYKVKK